jgi:hypothetical protein
MTAFAVPLLYCFLVVAMWPSTEAVFPYNNCLRMSVAESCREQDPRRVTLLAKPKFDPPIEQPIDGRAVMRGDRDGSAVAGDDPLICSGFSFCGTFTGMQSLGYLPSIEDEPVFGLRSVLVVVNGTFVSSSAAKLRIQILATRNPPKDYDACSNDAFPIAFLVSNIDIQASASSQLYVGRVTLPLTETNVANPPNTLVACLRSSGPGNWDSRWAPGSFISVYWALNATRT